MIFLDADGVFADLHTPIAKLFNFDMANYTPGHWEMADVFGVSQSDVWDHPEIATAEFWANLPKTPWADELMAVVSKKYPLDEQVFLTKPVRNAGCASGKMAWFQKNYPKHKFLIGTSSKGAAAGPHKVLLDDHCKNVDEFDEAGGRGILFPRIWNKLHFIKDPVAYVKERL